MDDQNRGFKELVDRNKIEHESKDDLAIQIAFFGVCILLVAFVLGAIMLGNVELDGAKIAQACGGPTPTPTPATIHHGTPQNGWMEYDVQVSNWSGLWIKTQTPSLNWTGNSIRDTLYEVAEEWYLLHDGCAPRIQITRISKEGGGDIGGSSHENGLDIDIRYFSQ